MAPRISWNTALTCGASLYIPVGLSPATEDRAKASNVSFKKIHKACKTPIKQKVWCPKHDRELKAEEIGRGFETKEKKMLLVDDKLMDAIEMETSSSIEMSKFVPIESVDPMLYDRSYFLLPGEGVEAHYSALYYALEEVGHGALCRYVQAKKEKLGLVMPFDRVLGLQTLFVHEDVRTVGESPLVDVTKTGRELASQIVEILSDSFDPEELVSEYRVNLQSVIESVTKQKKPKKVVAAPPKVHDYQAALKATVAELKASKKAA